MLEFPGDRVAVTPIFDSDISPGGIIIPEIAQERADQGIVKYVGPKVKNLKIGDYVFFSGYTGDLLIIEGEGKLIVFREKFAVARLTTHHLTQISGIYFKDRNGEFFEASYEEIFNAVADYISKSRQAIKLVGEIPKPEDYDDELDTWTLSEK